MASSLRECACGYAGCEGGEICLLYQIHKQRTPQLRASRPDRRVNRRDETEKRHTGAQRGAFSPSLITASHPSAHRVDVAVPTRLQQSKEESFDRGCVWEAFSEIRQLHDPVQPMSAGRVVSAPLVLPVFGSDHVKGLLGQRDTPWLPRSSPCRRERLGMPA